MFSVLCQVADDAGGGGVNRVRKKKNEMKELFPSCPAFTYSPPLVWQQTLAEGVATEAWRPSPSLNDKPS